MTDTLFEIVTKISETNNKNMKVYKEYFEKIPDRDIRKIYKENGENIFEPFKQILETYKNSLIPNNLKSIRGLKEENQNPNEIEKLNELNKCEKLEKESLKIIDEILDIFKNIMEHRLNNAIIGKLEGLSRDTINENKIEPRTPLEKAVLEQLYKEGGLRKRKNNKKYTKNRTYEISKKYVSKKNKTRKLKKNYV
jgi:hypothetical protein